MSGATRRAPLVPVSTDGAHSLELDPGNPLRSAREFLKRRKYKLRYQGGVPYLYDGSAYRAHDEQALRSDGYHFLESAKRRNDDRELVNFDPTRSKVDNFIDALRGVTNLPTTKPAPCWLEDDPDLDPFDIMSCSNGLVHIPTRVLLDPTPNFYTHQAVPFAFDPEAPPPAHWERFLNEIWPNDVESQRLWQEWVGYLLTSNTRFQKIMLDVGPPRCGKGVRARVARMLVGSQSYCSPSLRDLSGPFGLQPLIGKSAAFISDARMSNRTDSAAVAEQLLRISGEDGPNVARKHMPDWTGGLSVRFTLQTNELPRIEDASGALASRFVVVRTKESWLGREDLDLEARFILELPGILNWALEGYARLYERGRFVQPQSAMELVRQFEDLGSPIRAFLGERCEVGPGHEVPRDELFTEWQRWCDGTGRKWTGTSATFGRDLRAALPGLGEGQRGPRGNRYWVHTGVSLQPHSLVAGPPR